MERIRELGGREVERTLSRMANEITERLGDPTGYVFVGILTGGNHVAERLADLIERNEGARPQTGTVDITLYRDDLYTGLEKPVLGVTQLPFEVDGQRIVLVDDVLFTGRTVRAALDELMDYGRPRFITLAVLVDRGHRELPIAADFVGRRIETRLDDKVVVQLTEDGSAEDAVEVIRGARGGEA